MQSDTFQTMLLSGHKGNAVEVPFDPAARWSIAAKQLWPGRRGFPVDATLEGKRFESAIVRRSRKFWLLVPTGVSDAAGISVGESGSFSISPRPTQQNPD